MRKIRARVFKGTWFKGAVSLFVMFMAFSMMSFVSLAAEGKVKANTNIRAQTSTDSEVVGSAVAGKTIDILEAVKDGAGTVWYKVAVANGGYGYIRSDLVETSESITVSAGTTSTQLAGNTSKPADTQSTAIEQQKATVNSSKSNSVNIRSGASTQHSIVTSLPNGTEITLIGEANDSSGKKWYQLTCNYNDKTVEGYVRSDLVASGGAPAEGSEGGEGENPEEGTQGGEGENPEGSAEGGEGENPEGEDQPAEPEPEEENNDYDIAYMLNESTGEYEYYFLNYTDGPTGTKTRVTDILNLINGTNENTVKMEEQVKNEKIIIIILAVVIVVLFIILTILLFKIRDLSYDDYEDDDDEEEEEEEEEEPEPVRKKVKRRVAVQEEEEPVPVKRKKSPAPVQERVPKSREKAGPGKARGEKELYAAERKEPVRKPAPRKSQNFLVDDDEFEFEFLNMDDKDL
ncbi:SH3 domain-containing protein [Parablautia intestinalis]|uniref:SH3 domain-containing protein n=1 Tax=Parablautia intestinalis TaxID=2320100 RepID=UPI0023BEA71E|nr:SH3 domain-containing protein [Parablautia intestinalis]MDE7048178.1 SH3 domain-containing protein [Lachnospiraceae bacterium]